MVELEVDFLNKVLRSKGLLPEKDTVREGTTAWVANRPKLGDRPSWAT